MKQFFSKQIIKTSIFLVVGGIGGFAYYYFIGCNSGSCPITSNPYISTTYGMIMGLVLSWNTKKETAKHD